LSIQPWLHFPLLCFLPGTIAISIVFIIILQTLLLLTDCDFLKGRNHVFYTQ
jgi:hypothetical protein